MLRRNHEGDAAAKPIRRKNLVSIRVGVHLCKAPDWNP